MCTICIFFFLILTFEYNIALFTSLFYVDGTLLAVILYWHATFFLCLYKNYLYSFKCCLFYVGSILMPFFDVNSQSNVICVKRKPVGPTIVEDWRGRSLHSLFYIQFSSASRIVGLL